MVLSAVVCCWLISSSSMFSVISLLSMFNTEIFIFSFEMKPRPGDFSERAALNEAV